MLNKNITSKLKKNITISYFYNFFMQLNITSAIWVLYLAFKGMSLIEIGMLESIYHITSLLFELPTGAIADIYGKKFSVVLGRALSIVSCICYIVSNNFFGFAVAFILSAASMNLNSGAAEALVFDSLKELGEEDKYKRIWGNLSFVMSIAQGAAALLGGILADVKFLYAYIAGTVIQVVALIAAGSFTELPEHKEKNEIKVKENKENEENKENKENKEEKRNIAYQIAASTKVLKARKLVLYIILFSALSGSLQTTVYFYSQSFFSGMSFSKTAIAIICTLGCLVEAISSKFAYYFEEHLKFMGSLILTASINVAALIGLACSSKLSVAFFLMTSVSGGFAYTVFSDYINSRIPSDYRATILSFDSLCFSLFMVCVFPLFGLLAQKIGFSVTFGVVALLNIPIMVFLIRKLRKHKNNETIEEGDLQILDE